MKETHKNIKGVIFRVRYGNPPAENWGFNIKIKKKMDNAFQLPLKEKELGKRFNCLAVVYDFIICYSFSSPFFVCHIFPVYHEALVSNHKKNPKLCVIVEDYLVEPFMNNLARSIPPYNSGCHNRPEPFPYCRVN